MTIIAATLALLVGGASPIVQSRPESTPARQARATDEMAYEGELETYVAVGGESTGWRLRRRTPEGKRQYIELLVTAEMAQGLRANTRVRVRGPMQTRHYTERGAVTVLVVKEVIEVARR
jgi:hypothetical protein